MTSRLELLSYFLETAGENLEECFFEKSLYEKKMRNSDEYFRENVMSELIRCEDEINNNHINIARLKSAISIEQNQ